MLLAVALQLAGAVVMKLLADSYRDLGLGLIVAGIGAVAVVNLARLGVWGLAHRRFPLSTTFPMSSLFYPALLGVAVAFGEDIGIAQLFGAILITSGSVWLTLRLESS